MRFIASLTMASEPTARFRLEADRGLARPSCRAPVRTTDGDRL